MDKVLIFLSIFNAKIKIIMGLEPEKIVDIFHNYFYSSDNQRKKPAI